MEHVLTLNAGSSSIKSGLFEAADEPVMVANGMVERIGGKAHLVLKDSDGATLAETNLNGASTHAAALNAMLQQIEQHFPKASIRSVGHRVVQGGRNFSDPTEVTANVFSELESLVPFAPLHQPHNLSGIAAAIAEFPQARQIACFDTAFHRNHPFVNDTFALPRYFYQKGIRRYGFHGLSYDYISGALKQLAPTLYAGRVVVAHLGNGASMCGMLSGQSVASSMGFSALDGLPMGTRCGQLDPGVMLYLMAQEKLSSDEISDLLYKKSGLLGLSEESSDMRTLLESDTKQAKEAIDYFCFRIRRELGGLAAALEGLDAVVFTGGIGENAAAIRQRVCQGMSWIGIEIDEARNASGAALISSDLSRVRVLVIPTDEELVIARAATSMAG